METNNSLAVIDKPCSNLYAIALQGRKIMDMPKAEAMKLIIDLLDKTYKDSGQIPIPNSIKPFAEGVYSDLNVIFSACTIDELKLCLYNGIRKEYGEFYGINVATVHGWIKAFIASEKRQKAKLEYNRPINKPAMTKEEAEEAWKVSMQKQFTEYKQTGRLHIEFPTYQFKEFEERGLISLSIEQKEALFKVAVNKVVELKRLDLVKVRTHNERVKIKGFIERVLSGNMTAIDKSEVQQMARRMAIEDYYDNIDELKF